VDTHRVDPATGNVRRFGIPGPAYAFAVGFGRVWVAGYEDGRLLGIDPSTGRILSTTNGLPVATEAIAVGRDSLWIASVGPWRKGRGGTMVPLGRGTLTQISPDGTIRARIAVGRGAGAVTVGARTVWVANFRGVGADTSLSRVDQRTNRLAATIRMRGRPVAVATGLGFAWAVTGESRGRVVRVDPRTNRTMARTVPGSWALSAIVVFRGRVWVASEGSATVTRLDPRTLASRSIRVAR
jgi:streptogramin lyase